MVDLKVLRIKSLRKEVGEKLFGLGVTVVGQVLGVIV
jgi:hypothetical protein